MRVARDCRTAASLPGMRARLARTERSSSMLQVWQGEMAGNRG